MNRSIGLTLSAAALLASGAVTATVLGTTVANGAPAATVHKPATVQMFADVDAEGDLGSHVGATKAVRVTGGFVLVYRVTFVRSINHCAGEVQIGKAGGPDQPSQASTEVFNDTDFANSFDVAFLNSNQVTVMEPFMLTVTCKSS